jgi:hypothetical protein
LSSRQSPSVFSLPNPLSSHPEAIDRERLKRMNMPGVIIFISTFSLYFLPERNRSVFSIFPVGMEKKTGCRGKIQADFQPGLTLVNFLLMF